MDYYRYDKEKLEKINELNKKISKDQQQIFDILLKISQSFSDENFSKEERNQMFSKVDVLKQSMKDYNEKLKEIKSEEYVSNKKESIKDNSLVETVEQVEKLEKKNHEFVNTAQKLEDTLKESEIVKEDKKEDKIIEKKENEKFPSSKRKKARTQLVVIEDDDSLSGKIKEFFKKLKFIMKK